MVDRRDNTLQAYFVASPRHSSEGDGSIAAWCPFCETVHYHGAAGEGGTRRTEARGAHCASERLSPRRGESYELDVVGTVADGEDLAPKLYLAVKGDPLCSRVRLHQIFGGGAMARAVIRAVFGNRRPPSGFDAKLVGGGVHVFHDGGAWWITDTKGETVAEGHDVGSLLASLFQVPLGIVALRIVEDAIGLTLSADYRLALVELIGRAQTGQPAPVFAEPE